MKALWQERTQQEGIPLGLQVRKQNILGTKRQDHMGPHTGLRNLIYQKAVRVLIRICQGMFNSRIPMFSLSLEPSVPYQFLIGASRVASHSQD